MDDPLSEEKEELRVQKNEMLLCKVKFAFLTFDEKSLKRFLDGLFIAIAKHFDQRDFKRFGSHLL